MICFVILHYMVIDETKTCVDSIKKLSGDKRMIIVDNASTNGSGADLFEYYKDDKDVDVLLNENNLGFAKGNNLGYQYACNNYNPEFIAILNNDIEIKQKDFINKIYDIYNDEKFAVLGPDIYATTLRIHQSPKKLHTYTYEEVLKLKKSYQKKYNNKYSTKIRCYLKRNKFLKRFVYNRRISNNSVDYKKKYYNIPLHGAFLIFSKGFINVRDKAFFEGTFMYYETEILDYECNRDKLKTMYTPELSVLHHHNVSTNATYKSDYQRTMFMNKCILDSLEAFLKIIESDNAII